MLLIVIVLSAVNEIVLKLNWTGTLRCLQKEMATYRHWSVSLWWDPDDVYIVESSPLTKLNGVLSRLHSADKDAVSWLTSYGSWNAYEKKKNEIVNHPNVLSTCKHRHTLCVIYQLSGK